VSGTEPSANDSVASSRRRARAHARWLLVFIAAWLISASVSFALIFLPGYTGDVSHYKYWTRVITTRGIQEIYHGDYPETYAIYPPVTLYAYGLVGSLYERLAENPWETERMLASQRLSSGIKGVSVAFHLLLGAVLFPVLARLYGERAAALGSAAYLLNPAVIFDAAYWGQPDAAHSLFAVLSLGLTMIGWWHSSWIAAGLAAMTKPQAWALVPLYIVSQLRLTGLRRVVIGMLLALVTILLILAPFIVHNRIRDFLTLPQQIAGVMPVASANAHNLWWIVSNNPAPVVLDSERVLGPVTYRLAALPMVLLVAAFTLWRLWISPCTSVFVLAAYQAFGWFCFTTQAHENHAFFVLPLLVMATPIAPAARVLLALISGTLLANMALHDPAIIEWTSAMFSDLARYRLQILNSWINLAILAGWTMVLLRRPRWCGIQGELAQRDQTRAVTSRVI
jgi:Gpi18-like mannosyltransferase